ncbi:MAG TPA: 3-oxoacyl-[acyl-carrier-protein] synthase III C-terminal domain-containing protein [Stellaceae bacterium]|nr:3-oxoacyl-[acyl-carrier-protein] synthase III C-terminal domain-containing protein [Stellaceae bacterium]
MVTFELRPATRGRRRAHSSEERRRSPAPTARPRLAGLTTAVPPHIMTQRDVADRVRAIFADAGAELVERLLPVYGNAGVERRHTCVPIAWHDTLHGWRERSEIYFESAVGLLERAAIDCLAQVGIGAREVDAIVVVSTSGIATPSLDAVLVNRLGLRADVRRLPIFGLGCAGGVLGLARAADLARLDPDANVLFLVVELCSLCFRGNDKTKSNFVSTALFGDGAAAALISARGDGPLLGAAGEHTWPDTLDVMGWDIEDDGLQVRLSRDVPTFVRERMRDVTAEFLDRQGLGLADIQHFISHPGGAKVLVALEEAFGLAEGTLADGRSVLRDYGNMSAATVLFVLDRTLKAGATGRMLMTAMGPGFSAAFQVVEVA